jgi:3-oxoacyl-[acyl-carrier-protein] synthase-3
VAGEDVGLVICATVCPDMVFPATATAIQHHIGAGNAPAFDISAACTGFVYALGIADQFIRSGWVDNAVVVGGEVLSKITDYSDRKTCVLFGDGAGAVVLQAEERAEKGIIGMAMHSDGSLGELIYRPGGGSQHPLTREVMEQGLQFLRMRGNETFKIAVRSMARVSDEALTACGLRHQDVSWFLPHQANLRIINAVGQRLEIREGRTYVNVDRFGNTSAASIPIALDELNRAGRIEEDDIVLFSAFGAGLTWGAGVVRW